MYVIPSLCWSGKPLMKQKQDFLKMFFYWSLWKKQPSCLLSDSPVLLGKGEGTAWGVGGWCWVYLRASTRDTGVTQCSVCVTQGGAGQHRIHPGPQLMEITAHSQCQITCNSWQRKIIKTIKQFVGFRGIKMSNWRLTTPTQGHFSKLSRDYQKYKSIQIKALCEQSGLIYWHSNGKHWLHTFHTFSCVGW